MLDVHSNGSFVILIFIAYLKLWIMTFFLRKKCHFSKHSEIDAITMKIFYMSKRETVSPLKRVELCFVS